MKLTGRKSTNVRDIRLPTGIASARAAVQARKALPAVGKAEQMVDQDIAGYVQQEMRGPGQSADGVQALVKRMGDSRKDWGWRKPWGRGG